METKSSKKSIRGIISFLILSTLVVLICLCLNNIYKTEDYRTFTISTSKQGNKTAALAKNDIYHNDFKALANNLGTIMMRFDTSHQMRSGLVQFRIKERNSSNWLYSNSYRTDQFQNDGLFPFGFPPISDSKGKTFDFEIVPHFGDKSNYLRISNPQYVARFVFTRADISKPMGFLGFLFPKAYSFIVNMSIIDVILIFSPLIFVIFIFLINQNTIYWFSNHWNTFLFDVWKRISLKRLLQWNRFPEIIVILFYFLLFWVSVLQLKYPLTYISKIVGALLILIGVLMGVRKLSILKAHIWLLLVVIIQLIVKLSLISTEPKWDGRLYFYLIQRSFALIKPTLDNFSAVFSYAGHPAHGYVSYLLIGNAFIDNPFISMHVMNTLLGIATLVALYGIIKKLYKTTDASAAVFTAFFGLNPLFIAISLSPNIDYPVVCFFIIALYLFLQNKLILSTFVFTLMAFSKEPGLLLYLFVFGFEFLLLFVNKSTLLQPYFSENKRQPNHKFFLLFGYFAYLSFPVLLFILRFLLSAGDMWRGNYYVQPYQPFVLNHEIFLTRLYEVFVLNFQWLLILPLIITIIIRRRMRAPLSLTLAFCAFLGVMVFYNTYTHPRYIMPLHALLILIAVPYLLYIKRDRFMLFIVLPVLFSLFIIQNYFTIDLLSQKLFGTFKWGNYKLLKIGDDMQSRCDGLVYNSQYTHIQSLYKQLDNRVRSVPYSVILSEMNGGISSGNSWAQEYTYSPYFEVKDLDKLRPNGEVYYLFLPWLSNNQDNSLAKIKKYYSIGEGKIINQNGYWLRYYKLQKLTK